MKVINGNNIDILKQYPDNYFDAIVTDPPYGLGKEPNAEELMKDWIEKGYHEISGTGFMGKEWDAFIPQPIFWKEAFRVLKHGGHVLSFFGTRTYDWGVMSMRFAGFEVRDCIQWIYGVGFPKSHNISKAIDKMYGAEREVIGTQKLQGTAQTLKGNNFNGEKEKEKTTEVPITEPKTDQAKQWDGWGSALKPANEPIVLARKPLEKGLTIAENVLKWGTGAINIDGCRVGTIDDLNGGGYRGENNKIDDGHTLFIDSSKTKGKYIQPQGRFPANLILTHHEDCECVGTKKVKPSNGSGKASENGGGFNKGMFGDGTSDNIGGGFTDENGEETIEDWNCVNDCPIKILDEQSGLSKSTGGRIGNKNGAYSGIGANGFTTNHEKGDAGFGDKGGASRFFKTFSQNDILYCYLCGKSNKNELWKNNYNNVLNVVSNLKNINQIKEPIVQESVTESLRKKADQIVKNVANLCDLCVTNFVQEVVKINNLDSKKEQLTLIQDFIQDCRKCTLLQSLVYYVEMMDNIDTTPTTQNLLKLFGYVWTAIENYIKKDIKEVEAQKLGLVRFQYQAKASKSERNKGLDDMPLGEPPASARSKPAEGRISALGEQRANFHPTVKPIKLMQYLVRLITPPNGIVLDPFCGSGTTGIACKLEGVQFIGIEQDAEYCKIAQARIDNYIEEIIKKPKIQETDIVNQIKLF